MGVVTRLAMATLLLAMLAACGRREETSSEAAAPTPGAKEAEIVAVPPPAAVRSLTLAQAGWRFQLDVAERPDRGTRVEVLATPATVGAAPLRWRAEVPGEFVEAFATDLDADGWPELLLWQRSGSAGEGLVEGWRLRPGGHVDALALPALEGDAAIGWRGRDQFGVQGKQLVRSFPLYRDEDDNASPSAGFLRVLRYRLDAPGFAIDEAMLEPLDGTPQAELLAR
jgi:hypothetical protein